MTMELHTMPSYLCYFEVHVDDRTFYEHVVVEAESSDQALQILSANNECGKHYHRQAKGVLGEMSCALAEKYMALRPSVAKSSDQDPSPFLTPVTHLLSDLPLANCHVAPEHVVGAIQVGLAEVGTPRFVLCHGLTYSRYVLPYLRRACPNIPPWISCSRLLPENTVWVVGDTTYTISLLV
jgi:hypothetical protein